MDSILVSGIEVFAWGGVTEAERQIGQRYRIDLALRLDLSAAADSDDLTQTVSYAAVHELAVATLRQRPFLLLESAAGRIATDLLATFAIEGVTVRLAKLLPPIDGIVAEAAVELCRTRPSPD